MCLVHEPENIHFWHGNELFTSYSRSFHGLFMAAPIFLADCVGEEREKEREWLAAASQLYVTLVIMKISLPRKGVSSVGHVSPSDMI